MQLETSRTLRHTKFQLSRITGSWEAAYWSSFCLIAIWAEPNVSKAILYSVYKQIKLKKKFYCESIFGVDEHENPLVAINENASHSSTQKNHQKRLVWWLT